MKRFRKKPVVIEAVQFLGDENLQEIIEWMGDSGVIAMGDYMRILTLEGEMTASRSDWIIKGVKGEFYPCKPDIFEATYESVKDHII